MGLLAQIAELDRARAGVDDKFYRSFLYYFELRVPPGVAEQPGAAVYFYPLILPPESLHMSEPFTVSQTPTNGGGLFVEEQGIIGRTITIAGTTGWKPRRQHPVASNIAAVGFPKNRSFTRDTTQKSSQLVALSGQRHFQFLQDTVFRLYGDLKQDPATAGGTELYFHNLRDDEHWRVVPLMFDLEEQNVLYRYNIELLAVQGADADETKFSEDKPVLAKLRDVFKVLSSATTNIRAGLRDLAAVEGQLQAVNGHFASMLTSAADIADATTALLTGATDIILMPFATVENAVRDGQTALEEWDAAVDANVTALAPAPLLNTIRKLLDNMMIIGSYPSQFVTSVQHAVEKFQRNMNLVNSRDRQALEDAANRTAPQSLASFAALGTGPLPGDQARSLSDLGLGRNTPKYQSASEWTVEQGDTLVSLAARFLGDARNWKYIALFNDLAPPFISPDGMPGTVRVGDRILIPSFDAPPTVVESPATFGVRSTESARVQVLGRDLRLDPVDRAQYDLVFTTNDVRTVAEIPNLKQALRTRVITEQGTDVMYRSLGAAPVVGTTLTVVDIETASFRLASAVKADPRVAGLRGLRVTDENDSVIANIDVEVRGFARPERVSSAVPAS